MDKNEEVWRLLGELIKSQQETDRRMKETDRRMKETDRRMGRWINGWGSFVEGLAAPSIPKIFKKFDIRVTGTSLDQVRHKDGETMEVDILCVGRRANGKRVTLAIEMKSRLTVGDVKAFTQDLATFLDFFEEYRGSDVIGVVGGIRIDGGVVEYAEKKGLCVMAPSEDIMLLLNKEGFEPKIWS